MHWVEGGREGYLQECSNNGNMRSRSTLNKRTRSQLAALVHTPTYDVRLRTSGNVHTPRELLLLPGGVTTDALAG